jgi:hyperosmotically inducible protein
MNWKQLFVASGLSLALTTGPAGMLPGSAQAADVDTPATPTIVTPADVSLAASVQATIASDQELPLANIAVSAKDGAVMLAGSIRSGSERSRAIQDAKSVPGVKAVYTDLRVLRSDF